MLLTLLCMSRRTDIVFSRCGATDRPRKVYSFHLYHLHVCLSLRKFSFPFLSPLNPNICIFFTLNLFYNVLFVSFCFFCLLLFFTSCLFASYPVFCFTSPEIKPVLQFAFCFQFLAFCFFTSCLFAYLVFVLYRLR